MAFIVQQDKPVEDANAYVTEAWVVDYHASRGRVVEAGIALQQAIVRASDYLDQRFSFIGRPKYLDQSTAWPRYDAYSNFGYYIKGIPLAVKKAVAEYTLIGLDMELNPTPVRDESGRSVISISETVGPISESARYSKSGAISMPSYPKADAFLARAGLVAGAGTIRRG